MTNSLHFDVVIPVSLKHNAIARLAVRSLIQHVSPRHIYIMTSRHNFHVFKNFQEHYNIILLDKNTLIPGITLPLIKDFLEKKGGDSQRAGWYFQQFLKMGACFLPNISDYYLVWDSDTLMLNPIDFINDRYQVLIKPSSEFHKPYFDTYYKITGLQRSADFSFISEHFLIKTVFMKELIALIDKRNAQSVHWVWKIMEGISAEHLCGSGFSEYETYGNYVKTCHPEAFLIRPLKTMRFGAGKFGPMPNKYDLHRLSQSYSYVSFESWNKGNPVRIFMEKSLSLFIYVIDKLLLHKQSHDAELKKRNC